MSLSANALYRTVSLSWNNYDASGSEYVQVFAKPSGGSWSLVLTVPVSGLDQTAEWDTALPLTAYEIAMRFVNVTVPTAGYEGVDPDLWTAPTAPSSKTTVTTTSAAITSPVAVFNSATSKIDMSWASAQLSAPYLIEKNVGAGWVTVIAGLVAMSYVYTPAGGELGTTISMRITAQRGAIVGPTSGTLSVPVYVVVGTPVITSGVFDPATGVVTLVWTAASQALEYVVERLDGAVWTQVAVVAALTTGYTITAAESNTTLSFRVKGRNGSTVGAVSNTQSVACPLTLPMISLSGIGATSQLVLAPSTYGYYIGVSFIVYNTPVDSQGVFEYFRNGVLFSTTSRPLGGTVSAQNTSDEVNRVTNPSGSASANITPGTYSCRARVVGVGPTYGPWSATVAVTCP